MAVWRTVDNWTYEIHAADTDAACFANHESLVELWHGKRVGEALPARSDFDFEDFRGWWGWVTIGELLDPEGGVMRFRLWGSKVAELTQLEMTGKTMHDHHGTRPDATSYDDIDLDFIRELTVRRGIGRSIGPVDWNMPDYARMETVRLPLADDGHAVDGFLSGVVAVPSEAATAFKDG